MRKQADGAGKFPFYVVPGSTISGILDGNPGNTKRGIPRASAVLILNDYQTGYPIACLEGAAISAARTAASARWRRSSSRGAAARRRACLSLAQALSRAPFLDYLMATTLLISRVSCLDLDPVTCGHFVRLAASNVVDDIEHCLKAGTSPHLAEQLSGSRAFITGTLGGMLRQGVSTDPDLPTVFSPFGLGVLDIAIGDSCWSRAIAQGGAISVPDGVRESPGWRIDSCHQ